MGARVLVPGSCGHDPDRGRLVGRRWQRDSRAAVAGWGCFKVRQVVVFFVLRRRVTSNPSAWRGVNASDRDYSCLRDDLLLRGASMSRSGLGAGSCIDMVIDVVVFAWLTFFSTYRFQPFPIQKIERWFLYALSPASLQMATPSQLRMCSSTAPTRPHQPLHGQQASFPGGVLRGASGDRSGSGLWPDEHLRRASWGGCDDNGHGHR